jgi:hypothetical protein
MSVKFHDVNSCKELFEIAQLKLDHLCIHFGLHDLYPDNYTTETSPLEFLKHAKEELHAGQCSRILTNVINQSSRSIDSSIDEVLGCLNIDTKRKLTQTSIEQLHKKYSNGDHSNDCSLKLKLISCILNAPTILVDNARKFRHSVEHNYQKPEKVKVYTAVETAQFLNLFIDSKTNSVHQIDITDVKLYGQAINQSSNKRTGLTFYWEALDEKTKYYLKFTRKNEDIVDVYTYEFKNSEKLLLMLLRACFFDAHDIKNTKKTIQDIISELTNKNFNVMKYIVVATEI